MSPQDRNTLPERDPVSLAVVGISFLLLVGWFVWSMLFPPILRVPPALRVEPIPRNFGVVERLPTGRPGRPGGGAAYAREAPTRAPLGADGSQAPMPR
jgi:hypothetical protein